MAQRRGKKVRVGVLALVFLALLAHRSAADPILEPLRDFPHSPEFSGGEVQAHPDSLRK